MRRIPLVACFRYCTRCGLNAALTYQYEGGFFVPGRHESTNSKPAQAVRHPYIRDFRKKNSETNSLFSSLL